MSKSEIKENVKEIFFSQYVPVSKIKARIKELEREAEEAELYEEEHSDHDVVITTIEELKGLLKGQGK